MLLKLILTCILLISAYTDINKMVIPDRLIISGAVMLALCMPLQRSPVNAAVFAASGAIVMLVILLPVSLLYEMIRKRSSIGGGDIKLLVLAGAFLGPWRAIGSLMLSCIFFIVSVIISGGRSKRLPWGPSIAVGTIMVMVMTK